MSMKLIVFVSTASLLMGACNSGSSQSGQQASAGPSSEDRCKELVRNNLKDPDSANFKDVQAAYRDGKLTLCKGMVNAKNAMGGYVGFRRFETFSDQSVMFHKD